MKKTLTVLGAIAFLMVAMVAIAAPHHGPDEVVIDAAAAKQAPVKFPHAKHATELVKSCDTCHHTNPGLTAATDKDVKACSSCHMEPQGEIGTMAEMSMKTNPLHVTCINCHKEEAKGPSKCNECHVK